MPKSDAAKLREARLAAKLRENLKRRKLQAKSRGAAAGPAGRPLRPPPAEPADDG